jgi:Holliday junction resolvase RusA-like endonuclease
MIEFTVYGMPVAKGRPRFTKKGFTYTPKETRDAENSFLNQALSHKPEKPLECPLAIDLKIYMPRPKSKPKKVWAWTTRPDLDNLIKILDALNGVFWHDDSQIILFRASKHYGDTARTEIKISEKMEDGTEK